MDQALVLVVVVVVGILDTISYSPRQAFLHHGSGLLSNKHRPLRYTWASVGTGAPSMYVV
jgi:hypothetical protein